MAVDAQHPVDVRGNLAAQFRQRAGQARQLRFASRAQLVRRAREQQARWHHEAVANDLDVLAVAQHFAQAAEELRAVLGQLVHPVGQRQVQLLAEVLDLHVLADVLRLRDFQRLGDIRQLLTHGGQLAIQQLDLRRRLRRQLGLHGQLVLVLLQLGQARGDLGFQLHLQRLQAGQVGAEAVHLLLVLLQRAVCGVEFALRGLELCGKGVARFRGAAERGRQLADAIERCGLVGLLHRQRLCQL